MMNAIELADALVLKAYLLGASDIHIEPTRDYYRIRLRVDGVLHHHLDLDLEAAQPLIARIKVLAQLDIAQSRLPQDGKIRYSCNDQTFDIRVSTFPSIYGQTVVLRLLVNKQEELSFEYLGLDITLQERVHNLLEKPQGFIIVTGPTGSGKTTTLYSALSILNTESRSIVTLEDPVEYSIDGVTQGHISELTGFTFARGIRSLLRQDPDVIMIGEIRDQESANIALEASMTGHLVLSTLHTNDACSTVIRLLDMGIEPYLLNAALTGVLAQRLLRRLCSTCRKPIRIDLSALGLGLDGELPQEIVVYEPIGCENCNFFGYKGRVGVFEFLEISEEIKEVIVRDASYAALSGLSRQQGMISLMHDAFDKLLAGQISMSEFAKLC